MYASIGETCLYYDVDGAHLGVAGDRLVERPQIVVLHGGPGFDQGYLRPGLGPLRDRAQLVFVDLRGQGRSTPEPAETCTLEQMADDITDLCRHLGLDQPILLGHSAGGFVALQAAVASPGSFGGLILCHTSATLAAQPDPVAGVGVGAPSLAERAGPEAAAIAARLFAGDITPDTLEGFERAVALYYAGPDHPDVPGRLFPLSSLNADIARHFFTRQAPHYDLRPSLAGITIPTLVITGGYDWVCPPAAARVLTDAIPGAELVTFENSGHFSFSEEPDRFHTTVAAFLTDLARRTGHP